MTDFKLYTLAAFPCGETGGNPAGVWVGDELPSPTEMQAIAADVGASETAFVTPASGLRRTVRYYSPEIEVPFCGHATIATGVVLGRRDGEGNYVLDTRAGEIDVTARKNNGAMTATFRSVDTEQAPIADATLQEALDCLGWSCDDLDPSLPPVNAFAGAWHLVIAVRSKQLLDALDYDFERLKALMKQEDLTTLQLVWREGESLFHSRNPFPVGGVTEDPATGAAAAALAGYLRDRDVVATPSSIRVLQGQAINMPSEIDVTIPASGGIFISGTARTY
jgi:PhzF family phenazine biosynthesis protein